MRYITFIMPPIESESALECGQSAGQTLTFEATYYLNLLDDGTNIELAQVCGDPEVVREILDTDPDVLTYDFVHGESGGIVYIHSRAGNLVNEVLTILVRQEIIVDWPIEYTDHGGLRVTIVGEDERIRRAFEEIPDEIQVTFEQIGDYEPDMRGLSSLLTDRQQEILQTAVTLGYYDIPRGTTLDDLGKQLNITAGTVGEHLRKIESKIIFDRVK